MDCVTFGEPASGLRDAAALKLPEVRPSLGIEKWAHPLWSTGYAERLSVSQATFQIEVNTLMSVDCRSEKPFFLQADPQDLAPDSRLMISVRFFLWQASNEC